VSPAASPAGRRRGRPRTDRYLAVLTLLVLTYVIGAIATDTLAGVLDVLLYSATLALALRTSGFGRRASALLRWALPVGSLGVLVPLVVVRGAAAQGVAALWMAGVLLLAVVSVVRRVLSHDVVTLQTIFGAISAYLLIGLAFAAGYGAFGRLSGLPVFAAGHPVNTRTLQYFSFTTLSTLGYGDFTMVSDAGRAVSVLEALTGQVFLATLVARLVAGFRGGRARAMERPGAVGSGTVSGDAVGGVMFTIGELARHGRVSVRMLRHYDAIGLLRPAHVECATGQRRYEAAQLARLNRIIALRDLGFPLRQVRQLLDEQVSTEQLRGMLRLRQAELAAAVAADATRLAGVEARLRTIESEDREPTEDVVVKRLPPLRVAELTAVAASYAPEDIEPVVPPVCAELDRLLRAAGITPTGRPITYYEDAPDKADPEAGAVLVHAAVPVAVAPGTDDAPFAVVDLPEARAATIVHRGGPDGVLPTYQALVRWVDEHGYRAIGYAREVYLDRPPDADAWVTELQQPIIRA
jgi:DNA-binding transcriptional MerR regulator